MCTFSMVVDHFYPRIPHVNEWYLPHGSPTLPFQPNESLDLSKLVKDMQEAADAAMKVDSATGQPDCVDPEKAKLLDRVRGLEALLQTKPEFVLVKGANLEPGKYRVIDGKLFKVIE